MVGIKELFRDQGWRYWGASEGPPWPHTAHKLRLARTRNYNHRAFPALPPVAAVVDTAELVWAKSSSSSNNWLASSSSRVRTVAVKRLKPHVLESKDEVLSFIQEARLLVNLRVSFGP